MTGGLPTQTLLAIFNEIAIIEQLSRNQFERVLPPGMSLAGFGVLNHFVRLNKESDSPAKLADAFQITRGAMTNTLQRLHVLGLVDIRPNPDDARAKRVAITQAGRDMRQTCLEAITPKLAELGGLLANTSVGAAQIGAILPALIEIRSVLDQNR